MADNIQYILIYYIDTLVYNNDIQAGAGLCQAQGKLRLARLLSYPCLICLINLVSLVLVGYRIVVDMFILVSLEW